jgi:hypothetical protein
LVCSTVTILILELVLTILQGGFAKVHKSGTLLRLQCPLHLSRAKSTTLRYLDACIRPVAGIKARRTAECGRYYIPKALNGSRFVGVLRGWTAMEYASPPLPFTVDD